MSESDLHPVVEEKNLPANLKQLWNKARAAADAKNDGYAVTICQSIVHQEPNFVQGRRLARRCAIRRKTSEKKGGLKINSGGLGVMNIKSHAKKDHYGALVELEKFLGDDPQSVAGNELLYDIAVAEGMMETAAFALETIFEGHPENKKIGHRLGDYYLTHGEPAKAGTIFETIKRRDPTDLAASQKSIAATAQDSMKKNKWDNEGTSMKDLIKSKDETASLESKNRSGMTKDMIADQIATHLDKYNEDQNDLANVKRLADLYEQFEDFENAHTFYSWAHHLSNGDVALETKVGRLKAKVRDLEIEQLETEVAETPDPDKQAHLDELKHNRNESRIAEAQQAVDR
ncbi:MAG: hypothetical protein P8J87_15410, partial [Verrucomicrobiales bacterium]|nr:hypothetical protein [Verrucomicrobiales bacterium]